MFGFLKCNMTDFEEYPEILERLKNGQKLLDLGCCFAQELRPLVSFFSSLASWIWNEKIFIQSTGACWSPVGKSLWSRSPRRVHGNWL